MATRRPYNIFLSYSTHHKPEIAKLLCEELEQKHCVVWMDKNKLRGGDKCFEVISEEIIKNEVFICLISNEYFKSIMCTPELTLAFCNNKIIIPILLEEIKPKYPPDKYALMLVERQYIDFEKKNNISEIAEEIVENISKLIEPDVNGLFESQNEDIPDYLVVDKNKSRPGVNQPVIRSTFYSGGADKKVKEWDINTRKCINRLDVTNIKCLKYLSNGKIATGDVKGFNIWNVNTKKCTSTILGHNQTVECIEELDCGILVSGSHDKTIKLWNIYTGDCIRTFNEHDDSVNCLKLLSNGLLSSGSSDNTVKLWDLNTYQCIMTLNEHDFAVKCLEELKNGCLCSGSHDMTIKLWNVKLGKCIQTLKGHKSSVNCLKVLDSFTLSSGSVDKTIKIWDIETSKCIRTLQGHESAVTCLKELPNGHLLSGSTDSSIRIWDTSSGNCIKALHGHEGAILSIC